MVTKMPKTTQSVSLADAKARLSELVERAAAGDTVPDYPPRQAGSCSHVGQGAPPPIDLRRCAR